MSVQRNAEQLVSYATSYTEAGIGGSNAAASSITSCIQLLQKIKEVTIDSIGKSAELLGDGHPGMVSIGGSGGAVNDKVNEVERLLEASLNTMIEMDQAITNHAGKMSNIGLQIMKGE